MYIHVFIYVYMCMHPLIIIMIEMFINILTSMYMEYKIRLNNNDLRSFKNIKLILEIEKKEEENGDRLYQLWPIINLY